MAQNYILGIGHPITETQTEAPPAVYSLDASGNATGLVGPGGERVSPQMQALIAGAETDNPLDSLPLALPPVWAASTTYSNSNLVRGLSGDDQNNLYHCTTGGTSAASGGPSGRGMLEINDNTAKWMYAGRALASTTTPLWSSAEVSSASDVMSGYLALANTSAMSTIGLTKTWTLSYGAPFVSVVGGTVVNNGGFIEVLGSNGGTLAAPNYSGSGGRWVMRFVTDAEKWIGLSGAGGLYSNRGVGVLVNGRRLSETNTNSVQFSGTKTLIIDLGKFGPGTKLVEIHGTYYFQEQFRYIYTNDYTNIQPWSPKSDTVITFEGDSITQGGGNDNAPPVCQLEVQVAKRLGIENWYNNAVGGSGYLNTLGGVRTTFLQRLPDVVSRNPDIHVCSPSVNDVNATYTLAQRRAAYLEYLRAVRAALPATTIVVTGIHMLMTDSLTSTTEPSFYNSELAMKSVIDEIGDNNTVWVPFLTAPQRFPESNANSTWGWSSPQSGGTNGHQVFRYYPVAGRVIANGIKAFFRGR